MIEITSLSAIEHILTHKPDRIKRLVFSRSHKRSPRLLKIQETARAHRIPVDDEPSRREEEPLTAFLSSFIYSTFDHLIETSRSKTSRLVLALDHLQDPQNFGALCRSADAFGVSGILIPKDRGVLVTPGVYHASAGAVETVPVILVGNLGEALRKLKEHEFWIVGTAIGSDAKPLAETPTFQKIALVMGAEPEGLSHHIAGLCDWKAEIPLKGKIQSLNVSAAGAILMYEFARRLAG